MASLEASTTWRILEQDETSIQKLVSELGVSRLSAKVLIAHGFKTPLVAKTYLNATLDTSWVAPTNIAELDRAAERLARAIKAGEYIVVFGDYDVDGISATSLLTLALADLGAEHVRPFIPYRQGEGYGMSTEAISRLMQEGKPDLLVTVDNGIANAEEVQELLNKGVDVVVTDHHEPGAFVPQNICVVDPKLEADGPSRNLAGAGVALKLVQALGALCEQPELWKDYVDLATLGTIADFMRLDEENRALVKAGVLALKATGRPGIQALAKLCKLQLQDVESEDLSYSLIPRLNAAGRMNEPQVALNLLLTKDSLEATELASQVQALNEARRELEAKESHLAISLAEQYCSDALSAVVWSEDFHDGIKGIVASRVMNATQKPAMVFSVDEKGRATGSGRSFGDLDLFKAISHIAEITERFGGHAQAVGVTLPKERLPEFHCLLDTELKKQMQEEVDAREPIVSCVPLEDLTLQNVQSLDVLRPFGSGNTVPLFCMENLNVRDFRRIGQDRKHASFYVTNGQYALPCVEFSPQNIEELEGSHGLVDVVFQPKIDRWQGSERVKLFVKETAVKKLAVPEEDQETAAFVDALFARAPEMLDRNDYAGIAQAESFFTKVVGISFENRQELAAEVRPGDRLQLKREPTNEYDPCAIQVLLQSGEQLGYVRKEIAQYIAPKMDEGRTYKVHVQDVTGAKDKGQSLGINIEVTQEKTLEEELQAKPLQEKPALTAREALTLTKELTSRFIGGHELLPAQRRALDLLNQKENVLCVMATGRGKSLIFHIHAAKTAILERKASVFVFPLRALVNDQAFHLEGVLGELGIKVARLTGESNTEEREEVRQGLANGDIQVLLTTPEYLALHTSDFAASERVGFVVFDESHHAGESKGGNRSSYQQMPRVLEELGQPTVLAVTATANDQTAEEIVRLFGIQQIIKDEAIRENLHIQDARGTKDREAVVLHKVSSGEKCVIYVNSRDQSVALARTLRQSLPELGHKIAFYNASLTKDERRGVEEAFRAGKLSAIVSTSAFGEGVNIGDIRHVVLYHMPFGDVEFNQMSGRAGRDGQDAHIHLLFGPKDAFINEHILGAMAPKRTALAALYKTLLALEEELTSPEDPSFSIENEAIAERVLEVDPKAGLDATGVSAGIAIFRELGFLETHGFSKARRITMVQDPERRDLSTSIRFSEGEKTAYAFSSFKDWVLKATPEELLEHINRPITPSFGDVIA